MFNIYQPHVATLQ